MTEPMTLLIEATLRAAADAAIKARDAQPASVPDGWVERIEKIKMAGKALRTMLGDGPHCEYLAVISGQAELLKEAMLAAPPAQPVSVLDGWMPIETAPRSGREPILLLTPSGFPRVAYSNTWWVGGFSVECWPTHWAPIAPLPTTEKDHE